MQERCNSIANALEVFFALTHRYYHILKHKQMNKKLGTISLKIVSISVEIWRKKLTVCCILILGCKTVTIFCTCHDRTTAMICANTFNGYYFIFWIRTNHIFHGICILSEKSWVKWTCDQHWVPVYGMNHIQSGFIKTVSIITWYLHERPTQSIN